MSTADAIKKLVAPRADASGPSVSRLFPSSTVVSKIGNKETEVFETIARAASVPADSIRDACSESADSLEWCLWIYTVVSGSPGSPPARPVPEGVVRIMLALHSVGVRHPVIDRIVLARRRLVEVVGKVDEGLRAVVESVLSGKRREAVESATRMLQYVSEGLRGLRVDAESVADMVVSRAERVLGSRVRLSGLGESVRESVVRALKGLESAERAGEGIVSAVESRVKPVQQQQQAVELKKLGEGEGAQLAELAKSPVLRSG